MVRRARAASAAVRRHHGALWARQLARSQRRRGRRQRAWRGDCRALSTFYGHGDEVAVAILKESPVANVTRPAHQRRLMRVILAPDELDQLVDAPEADGWRSAAQIRCWPKTGNASISEIAGAARCFATIAVGCTRHTRRRHTRGGLFDAWPVPRA